MNWTGSCSARGDLAAGAATRAGVTPLEALIVGEVASYGRQCWITDVTQAAKIQQKNGRNPHPRSVARCRRSLVHRGFMNSQRIGPGAKLPDRRYVSAHGTTLKGVRFAALGLKDPIRAIERQQRRDAQETKVGPRHCAALTPSSVNEGGNVPKRRQRTRAIDPMLARDIDAIEQMLAEQDEAEDREMLAGLFPHNKAPP